MQIASFPYRVNRKESQSWQEKQAHYWRTVNGS